MGAKPERPRMKKISIVFVSLLSIAAFTGCKKKGGDCAATINGMMDRMMQDGMKGPNADKMTPEMKKMGEEMMKKVSEPMIKACTDDKWSAEALKCMDEAKTDDDGKKCEAMLTPDQTAHVEKATKDAMGGMMGADHAAAKMDNMAGSAPSPPSPEPAIAADAASALGNLGANAAKYVPDLDNILKDEKVDANVRASAASALGNLGANAAKYVPDLDNILKDEKVDANVRASAASALATWSQCRKIRPRPRQYPQG